MWDPLTETIIRLMTLEGGPNKLQEIADAASAPRSEELALSLLEATAHLLKMGRTTEATLTATIWVELLRRRKDMSRDP
jgi:hypothetical protein